MPNVAIISGGPTGNSFVYDGITFYQWSWTVEVDGQVGIFTEWVDTNDPADAAGLEQGVIDDLEENPGDLGGIAEGDGTGDDGAVAGGDDAGDDDGGDDDGAVASGDGSDYGDSA
jgi:hypothetical protein